VQPIPKPLMCARAAF